LDWQSILEETENLIFLALFHRIFCDNGNVLSLLWGIVVTSHIWLLNTWSKSSKINQLNVSFYLILINVNLVTYSYRALITYLVCLRNQKFYCICYYFCSFIEIQLANKNCICLRWMMGYGIIWYVYTVWNDCYNSYF
jgi:hypothetical protein